QQGGACDTDGHDEFHGSICFDNPQAHGSVMNQEEAAAKRDKNMMLLELQEKINGYIRGCAKCRYWIRKRVPRVCGKHAEILKTQGLEMLNG
ncbi:MAG: hypothetical protein KGJ13_12600, partial [Patescibacteria group bacterium]|nr:hypothetical protein [Patescibacteria group bacterium]